MRKEFYFICPYSGKEEQISTIDGLTALKTCSCKTQVSLYRLEKEPSVKESFSRYQKGAVPLDLIPLEVFDRDRNLCPEYRVLHPVDFDFISQFGKTEVRSVSHA